MLLSLILSNAFADEDCRCYKRSREYHHSISLGYQNRTLKSDSVFRAPHLFVMQYGGSFLFQGNKHIGFVAKPTVALLGLNQSVVQPNASLMLGFHVSEIFAFTSGPLVSLHPEKENPFFFDMMMEVTFVWKKDGVSIPISFGYKPDVDNYSQIQFLVGYSWKEMPRGPKRKSRTEK